MIRCIEVRNMHSGIHELYILDVGTVAKEIIELIKISQKTEENYIENEMISAATENVVEVNYRDIETNKKGNRFYWVKGLRVFVMNDSCIDVW